MKKFVILILICLLTLSSCHAEAQPAETTPNTTPDTSAVTTSPVTSAVQETAPQTNAQLFEYIISKWKQNSGGELYQYASPQLASLIDEANFAYLFDSFPK